jgi:hypothetical protein
MLAPTLKDKNNAANVKKIIIEVGFFIIQYVGTDDRWRFCDGQ